MKIGSLCSGYGGLEMATVAAFGAGRAAWFCEVDPCAAQLLKHHHPEVPNHGSIVGADWSAVEPVHVLTMGPPCQPVSSAGRQRVEFDPRWLWPDALRAIHALRPRGVVFENVRNLISIRGGSVWRGILDDFREAGYAVRWLTLGACTVGAPHHRHRVFLLAVRTAGPAPEAVRVDAKECDPVRPLLPTPTARDGDSRGEGSPDYWAARAASRGGEGAPLGAAVRLLPTVTARDGRSGPGHSTTGGMDLRTTVARLIPTPRASDARNGGPNQGVASGDLALSSAVIGDRWGQFAPSVAYWEAVLGRPAPDPTEVGPRGGLRLAAELPEWMQGLPAGYLADHLARADALRLAGNGVCPMQGGAALRRLLQAFE